MVSGRAKVRAAEFVEKVKQSEHWHTGYDGESIERRGGYLVMTWKELCRLSHGEILTWAEDQPWCRAMAECPQDEGWHSEGDVWTHTKMVCAQLPLLMSGAV